MQKQAEWILCPVCGNKTHDRIRYDPAASNAHLKALRLNLVGLLAPRGI